MGFDALIHLSHGPDKPTSKFYKASPVASATPSAKQLRQSKAIVSGSGIFALTSPLNRDDEQIDPSDLQVEVRFAFSEHPFTVTPDELTEC